MSPGSDPPSDRTPDQESGQPAPGHPEVLRLTAPNPGPMTLSGTNTYVVGRDPAYVIDPGPADRGHLENIRAAAAARGGIAGVVLTHSHRDHTEGVSALGAPLLWGEVGEGDESSVTAGQEARSPAGGAGMSGPRKPDSRAGSPGAGLPATGPADDRVGPFAVIPTPGHASDHVCFVYEDVCFCGDVVLGEGSSIVPPAPMGGSLADYLASLERLARLVDERAITVACPGHGPWIADPAARIAEYRRHRLDRERALLDALAAGQRSRTRLLDAAWGDVPEPMRPAAAVAMQAHLEKLADEGRLPEGLED